MPEERKTTLKNKKTEIGFNPKLPYVFISYAHVNEDAVLEDVMYLKSKGVNCWIDFENLDGGRCEGEDDWTKKVAPVLKNENCAGVIIYVSEKAFPKNGLMFEAHWLCRHTSKSVYSFFVDFEQSVNPEKMAALIDASVSKDDEFKEKRKAALSYVCQTDKTNYEFSYYHRRGDLSHLEEPDFKNWIKKIFPKADKYGIEKIRTADNDFYEIHNRIIGRDDLINDILREVRGEKSGPFAIKGVAGSGKSAIAYLLSEREEIRAVHRCKFGDHKTRKAAFVIQNLAYYYSLADEEYASSLSREDLENLAKEDNAETLYRRLFTNRINAKEKIAFVIDALDEMDFSEAKEIVKLIKKYPIKNLKFIFTVRSEQQFNPVLNGMTQFELTDELNLAAAEEMLREELTKRGLFSEALLQKILKASEGNFLYITKLFEDFDDNGIKIDENTDFPQGLSGWYLDFMDRCFADRDYGEYKKVLKVLCVCARAVTADELCALTGIGREDLNSIRLALKSLIKVDNNKRISLFHRSVYDFLTSDDTDYYLDVSESEKAIVDFAKMLSVDEIKDNSYLNDSLFYHIFKLTDSAFADELYDKDDDWCYNCSAASVQYFDDDEFKFFAETVEKMEEYNGYNLSAGTFELLIRDRRVACAKSIAENIEGCYPRLSYILMGDYCYESDEITEAKKWYNKTLEIDKQNVKENPSYRYRRRLSETYNVLGDIALKEDDVQEAKNNNSEGLEIAKENAKKHPSYQSLRDLSVSYEKMGNIALKEDDVQEAKRLYALTVKINSENKEKYPSYESYRTLSVSYEKMGDIALKEDNVQGAKNNYSHSLEIRKENAKKYPSYESLRDLSVSWYKLAQAELKDKNFDKAKEYCEKALEPAKIIYEAFPCQDSKTVYDTVSELLKLIEEDANQ